jgi:hypothetical protein
VEEEAQHSTLLPETAKKEDRKFVSEGSHTFFITGAIWLMKQCLAVHDEFSDSPVDQVRQGWHRVPRQF